MDSNDAPFIFVGSRFFHRDAIRAGKKLPSGAVLLTLDVLDEAETDAEGRPLGVAQKVHIPAGEAADRLWHYLQTLGVVVVAPGERGED
jgi:hypothetical protein